MAESLDREPIRRAIAAVLAKLPYDADVAECRKALKAISPYKGKRPGDGRGWVCKLFTSEVRKALEKRLPKHYLPRCCYTVSVKWFVDVHCDWCVHRRVKHGFRPEKSSCTMPRSAPVGGCLMCGPMREAVHRLVHLPGWLEWRRKVIEDGSLAPICADWIEDSNGPPEVANLFRDLIHGGKERCSVRNATAKDR